MKLIDLRSDTVTKPSRQMRQVMASAEVGDDVFGDDPTVKRLEEKVAALFGKEAALYVASGSMGNLVATKTLTNPGDEIICEEGCHIINYEAGALASISGLVAHTFRGKHGVFTRAEIEPYLKTETIHTPGTKVIAIENTHNRAGGTIFPLEEIKRIRELAIDRGIKMHLDGARIWNAHAVTGIPLDEYARYFDSISICFSKGLGAPIGSAVLGNANFIAKARRTRKLLGGGMRQVGIIASAALFAVENNIPRLVDDHKNARHLAKSLAKIRGIEIDLETVQTNIVIMNIAASGLTTSNVLTKLKEEGIQVVEFGTNKLRCVAHLDVDRSDIDLAINKFKKVFGD